MSARIAEFEDLNDAAIFQRAKGEHYTVCGGINKPWAVRPKDHREECDDVFCEECADIRYEVIPGTLGRSDEPPDYKPAPMSYDEDERYDD